MFEIIGFATLERPLIFPKAKMRQIFFVKKIEFFCGHLKKHNIELMLKVSLRPSTFFT